jgi:soluble lytic murein transglycosylase
MKFSTYIVRLLLIAILFTFLIAALFQTTQVGRLYYPYRYRQAIEANATIYGVDPHLVAAVIRVESKFHAEAVSRKGALGLMQIMPATAEWIAPQIGFTDFQEEMLLDPEVNIRLGTWYLANLAKEFDSRTDVVIAAYNGGRGQVNRWLEEGVWSGKYDDRANIPFPETRNFLFKVKTAYRQYQKLY